MRALYWILYDRLIRDGGEGGGETIYFLLFGTISGLPFKLIIHEPKTFKEFVRERIFMNLALFTFF